MRLNFKYILGLFIKRLITAFKMLFKSSFKVIISTLKLIFIQKPLLFIKSFRLFSSLFKLLFGGTFLYSLGIVDFGNNFLEFISNLGIISFFKNLGIISFIKNSPLFSFFKKVNVKSVETIENIVGDKNISEDIKKKVSEKLANDENNSFITRKDYKDAIIENTQESKDSKFKMYLAITMATIVITILIFFFGTDIMEFFNFNKKDDSSGGGSSNSNKGKNREPLLSDDESDTPSNNQSRGYKLVKDLKGNVLSMISGKNEWEIYPRKDDSSGHETTVELTDLTNNSNSSKSNDDLKHLDSNPRAKNAFSEFFQKPEGSSLSLSDEEADKINGDGKGIRTSDT